MPRFKEAASTLSRSPIRTRLPEIPKTEQSAARNRSTAEVSEGKRADKDYDVVARALVHKLRAGGELTWRELRDAAWCLWTTEPSLAANPAALEAVLRGTEACERRQPARALAASYMVNFGRDRQGIDVIARSLARLAQRMGEPWANLHDTYSLFGLAAGPANVGRAALSGRVPPSEVLRYGGLGSFDAQSGFAQAAAAEALRQIASDEGLEHKERLDLVRKIGLKNDRNLQFQEQAPLVAEALTRPFGTTMPDRATKDSYLDLLIGLFGDPRLKPGGWTRMPDSETIVRKWLTEQTLRQFLDVVDRVALERMWKYRRAFWEAVHRADLISDAWVVFDSLGAAEARRAFGNTVSFARFSGGVQQGQAVLLLRIGRGIVAEWSHNGKCHIWNDADDREAPKTNQLVYPAFVLRAHGTDVIYGHTFSVSHMAAESYGWQRKVAAKIETMTGFRLLARSYQIR